MRGRGLVALLALVPAACGSEADNPLRASNGNGNGDGGREAASGPFVEAAHSPLPQLTYHDGPLLRSPEIVTVTFQGRQRPRVRSVRRRDHHFDLVERGSRRGFATVTGDDRRGEIGAGTSASRHRRPRELHRLFGRRPSTLQTFLDDAVVEGVLPPPNANTLYVLYLPASVVVTTTSGTVTLTSCESFRGYHGATFPVAGGTPVPYVVIPECPATGSSLTPLQALTLAASHEILEAATDPAENVQQVGYYLDLSDRNALGWNLLAGGEAADLCQDVTGLHQDETAMGGYVVQRIWSNTNAARGLDPCVPTPTGDVYFAVAPGGSSSFLVLPVGGVATFEATAFSSQATAAWTLEGIDIQSAEHGLKAPLLSFSFDGQATATVNNGDKVQVTVTLDADPEEFGGAEGMLLSVGGSLSSPKAAHPWPIVVVTPDEVDGGA